MDKSIGTVLWGHAPVAELVGEFLSAGISSNAQTGEYGFAMNERAWMQFATSATATLSSWGYDTSADPTQTILQVANAGMQYDEAGRITGYDAGSITTADIGGAVVTTAASSFMMSEKAMDYGSRFSTVFGQEYARTMHNNVIGAASGWANRQLGSENRLIQQFGVQTALMGYSAVKGLFDSDPSPEALERRASREANENDQNRRTAGLFQGWQFWRDEEGGDLSGSGSLAGGIVSEHTDPNRQELLHLTSGPGDAYPEARQFSSGFSEKLRRKRNAIYETRMEDNASNSGAIVFREPIRNHGAERYVVEGGEVSLNQESWTIFKPFWDWSLRPLLQKTIGYEDHGKLFQIYDGNDRLISSEVVNRRDFGLLPTVLSYVTPFFDDYSWLGDDRANKLSDGDALRIDVQSGDMRIIQEEDLEAERIRDSVTLASNKMETNPTESVSYALGLLPKAAQSKHTAIYNVYNDTGMLQAFFEFENTDASDSMRKLLKKETFQPGSGTRNNIVAFSHGTVVLENALEDFEDYDLNADVYTFGGAHDNAYADRIEGQWRDHYNPDDILLGPDGPWWKPWFLDPFLFQRFGEKNPKVHGTGENYHRYDNKDSAEWDYYDYFQEDNQGHTFQDYYLPAYDRHPGVLGQRRPWWPE